MKSLIKIIGLSIIGLSSCFVTCAQTIKVDKKAARITAVNKLITGKRFVFRADIANPSRGMQTRQLSGEYDLTLTGDSLVVFLPYFGRAYLADYNSATEGGIKFTTTHFDYKVTNDKKGYTVMLTPKNSSLSDPRAVKTMRMDISPDGYASLQVVSLNRDPISFNGEITNIEKPKN